MNFAPNLIALIFVVVYSVQVDSLVCSRCSDEPSSSIKCSGQGSFSLHYEACGRGHRCANWTNPISGRIIRQCNFEPKTFASGTCAILRGDCVCYCEEDYCNDNRIDTKHPEKLLTCLGCQFVDKPCWKVTEQRCERGEFCYNKTTPSSVHRGCALKIPQLKINFCAYDDVGNQFCYCDKDLCNGNATESSIEKKCKSSTTAVTKASVKPGQTKPSTAASRPKDDSSKQAASESTGEEEYDEQKSSLSAIGTNGDSSEETVFPEEGTQDNGKTKVAPSGNVSAPEVGSGCSKVVTIWGNLLISVCVSMFKF